MIHEGRAGDPQVQTNRAGVPDMQAPPQSDEEGDSLELERDNLNLRNGYSTHRESALAN